MSDDISLKYNKGRLELNSDKNTDCSFWLYPPLCLTHTELQILYYLLEGNSIENIASYRNRSSKTIWGQKKQIYKKLGVESDATLYRDLIEKEIISIEKNTAKE